MTLWFENGRSAKGSAVAIALAAAFAIHSVPTWAAECEKPVKGFEMITKAPVDECFNGVGKRYPGMTDGVCNKGEPKRNAAYVWGLAKTEDDHLFWGTVANSPCVFFGGLSNGSLPIELGPLYAPETGWVCEFDQAWYAKENPQLGGLGDWRPPHLYRMDACTLETEEITPDIEAVQDVLGFRAVGTVGNLVLMGGPGGVQEGVAGPNEGNSIYIFAFAADTGAFLGAKKFPEFGNIRQFVTYKGKLYSGAALTTANGGTGQILRWSGKTSDPFSYKVVGEMPSRPANLAIHEGRLFASTWPNTDFSQGSVKAKAGVVMSPVIPAKGLKPYHKNKWQTVWTVDEYEPDPVTAASYAGGAIRSWKGKLYWGTMHFPTASFLAHLYRYGVTWDSDAGLAATIAATHRATAVFRGKNFGEDNQKVELLYGEAALPTYVPGRKTFGISPTKAGPAKFGTSGFGNPFNAYVWQAGVTRKDLFMGTFDSSRITAAAVEALAGGLGAVPQAVLDQLATLLEQADTDGADLYRFVKPSQAAIAANVDGGGNPTNYGFRTMVAESKSMWLGTANPFNLDPRGGWEMLRYKPPATVE